MMERIYQEKKRKEYDIEISFSEDSNTYYQSMDFNNSKYKEVWKRIE